MSELTWPCEHIFRGHDGRWLLKRDGGLDLVHNGWDKCPVKGCNAKRPEEPKALWEHLSNLMDDTISDGFYKEMSRHCLRWVKYNLRKNVKLSDREALDIPIWTDKEIDKCK